MPKIKYEDITFNKEHSAIIKLAIKLVNDYRAQGYALTLRQLYYQFVSRDKFPQSWIDESTGSTNNEKSYKKLGNIISDARMAGLIDWKAIEDRTRELDGNTHWDSPQSVINAVSEQFKIDKWENQTYRVEVWVEKDALEGVVGKVAKECDVDFFSCRGYTSMTAIWDAGQRLKEYAERGQKPVILHLGDHDPSGIDMSRDIEARVSMFMDGLGHELQFKRIALNMPQVDRYSPPPNPAKVTDSRAAKYIEKYGRESWELDALDPTIIDDMIRKEILEYREEDPWEESKKIEDGHIDDLKKCATNWDTIVERLNEDED